MERLYSISEVAELFGLSVPTLRYYEEIGIVRSTARRGRVRQYDRAALERLAYAQLWHEDGMMTLAETLATMNARDVRDRHARITVQRDATLERLRALQRAVAVLDHLLDCPQNDPLDCPVTGAYIRARVDAPSRASPSPTTSSSGGPPDPTRDRPRPFQVAPRDALPASRGRGDGRAQGVVNAKAPEPSCPTAHTVPVSGTVVRALRNVP
ncbi:MerR family transcriptional regulator [Actinomadura sp. CNU-125]|uniref:MerR family transcriptional regulator n=1 Tax=Actinomadura sp. CNU-125 TaxID=1904961 RepID=UPI00117792E9|nr:MerR family transcriptional regulator [Actinomadura sp. CNU-125]